MQEAEKELKTPKTQRVKSVKSAASSKHEWTPWKDCIHRKNGHRDAVVYMEVILDRALSVGDGHDLRRCLLTISADGAAKFFELGATGVPPNLRRKLALEAPASALVRVGVRAAKAQALAAAAGGYGESVDEAAALHSLGADGLGVAFCTTFAYRGPRPQDQEAHVGAVPPPSVPTPVLETRAEAMIFGGYESGVIVGWKTADGSQLVELSGHSLPITVLRVLEVPSIEPSPGRGRKNQSESSSPPEPRTSLLSASHDGTLRGWHVCPLSGLACCTFVLEFGTRNPVSDLIVLGNAASGTRLIAGAWDGLLRSIDLETCACTNMVQATFGAIQSICVGATDGSTVYVGAENGHIHSWHFPQAPAPGSGKDVAGRELCAWKAHSAHVLQIRMWNTSLVSMSEDWRIRIWSPVDGQLLEEFYGHVGAILSSLVSVRDQQLWTGSRDHSVRSWDLLEAGRRIEERAIFERMDGHSLQFRRDYAKMQKDKRRGKTGGRERKIQSKSPSRKKSPDKKSPEKKSPRKSQK